MMRQPFTLLIHIALVIIMTGAIVTHYFGIQGELVLSRGDRNVSEFTLTSGPGENRLPFSIDFESADIEFYPGTTTPMDFRSRLRIDGKDVTVAMNKVAEIDGWRFYQSGISPDSTRLTVSHDPLGTGITYLGYATLLIGMAGFFFQRNSLWRALVRAARKAVPAILCLLALNANAADTYDLPAMQRPLAANMGKAYVYWNDRICPLQTMAKDVSRKLYGSDSYRGMTPEQILSGWLFYFDTWERDYISSHPDSGLSAKEKKQHDERLALIHWLGTGEAFRIYPYLTAGGHMEWLSLTGKRPSQMNLDQWKFMQTSMPEIKGLLLEGRNIAADKAISRLIEGQIRYAGEENLPSGRRILVERIYNRYASLLPAALLALTIGFIYMFTAIKGYSPGRIVAGGMNAASWLILLYLSSLMAVLWWISGHIPLSNGPEMMIFMGLFAMICSLTVGHRMLKGAFIVVAAMTLFVGLMGGRTPRIGMLMPVLASPLLSVHVMLVMISYVFFLIMAVLAAMALSSRNAATVRYLSRINSIILVPAVFLLAAGIFVGAVWANQSWGRYWGWDPKETCALVMLLIYSVPIHRGSRVLRAFRKPKVMQWYLLCAVLTVAFTYFGANYFLSGLHSYA
ncbi:MAG: cytochrome c biogenesis protein CcsA [Muribaculaceae bacterium]|nr:cytochrome c biogenesis protein CcsA [Muribaculaceae bacterium]